MKVKLKRLKKFKKRNIVLVFLIGVNVMLALLLASPYLSQFFHREEFPEVQQLRGDESYEELRVFLVNLAKEKGGKYAYDFLLNNEFSSGIDLHLLGHVVGEEMYIQDGLEAMKYCTPELQNACSHAIVSSDLLEHGEDELLKMKEICKNAPGNSTAYLQCFHGLGHGVISYAGYDLRQAIVLCERAGDYEESNNCVGGVVMELVGGGSHDKALWQERRAQYFITTDPLAPCSTNRIPSKYKNICYTFLTPHLLGVGEAKSITTPENIVRAFGYCNAIPYSNKEARDVCFGAFGKEFAVLATGRRISSDYIAQKEELQRAYGWCKLSADTEGVRKCIEYALSSYYWGGENPVTNIVSFCGVMESEYKTYCYEKVVEQVLFYNEKDFKKVCDSIPVEYKKGCF